MVRLSGWYVPSSGLAISPSSPAPSNWPNHRPASSRSTVAGVRCTGGRTDVQDLLERGPALR